MSVDSEVCKYPAMNPERKNGDEPILSADGRVIGKLSDFWQWAYSDLVGNAERGAFAEYIVASALGVQNSVRVSWDRYDLLSKEGIAIEVKTSGYIQTWQQNELSKLQFGISPTFGWNSATNEYDSVKARQSDIYVFCVHKHTDQETINPLDTSQWDFYLLPTKVLNEKFGQQKSASLSSLVKAGAVCCQYDDLYANILLLNKKR